MSSSGSKVVSSSLAGENRVDRAGAGEGDDAGAGAEGAHAGEVGGAGVLRRAGDDHSAAERALMGVGGRSGRVSRAQRSAMRSVGPVLAAKG